jgi:hypothetical protein
MQSTVLRAVRSFSVACARGQPVRGRIPRTSFFFRGRIQTRHFDFWVRAPHRVPVRSVRSVDLDHREFGALVFLFAHVKATPVQRHQRRRDQGSKNNSFRPVKNGLSLTSLFNGLR